MAMPRTSSPSRRSSGGCPRPGPRRSTCCRARPQRLAQGRRGDERRAVPDRGLPGRPDHAAVRVLRRRLQGHHRGVHGRAAATGPDQEPGDRVVHDHPVRHEPRGHGGLVLPGRRAQALGGDVRRLQPRAAPRPGVRPADGRMVPEEDQHDRRLQGAQDAHRRASAARSSPRRAARRSSPRPPRSTPRSSGA